MDVTPVARTLLDDASVSAMRTTLQVVPGTDVQGYSASLAAVAALSTGADLLAYMTGTNTWATSGLTSLARSLLDDVSTLAMRTTLEIPTYHRVKASADVTFYINSATGNDGTGDGTLALPWATIGKGISEGAKIDGNGFNLTIDVADGTYNYVQITGDLFYGWQSITVDGNATTPANVQLTSGYSYVSRSCTVTLKGLTFSPGSGWFALEASNNARVTVTDCALGVCSYGFVALNDASINVTGGSFTFWITSPLDYVFYASDGGAVLMQAFVYISPGVTWSNWFWVARGGRYSRGLGGSGTFTRVGSASPVGGRGLIGKGGIVGHQVNTYPDPGTTGPTYEANSTGIYDDEIKFWRSYNIGTSGSTDYERLTAQWASNAYTLSTGAQGTGLARDIALNAGESSSANILLQTGGTTR